MTVGPAWLPSPDPEAAASLVGDGLQHLPSGVLSSTSSVLASAEPTTLVMGTVVGTLAKEEVGEYSRKLDRRLQEYVDEHESDDAIAAKMAAGVSRLLPDGRELNQAALQAARGDPDALREKLREYHGDEQLRADLDAAVEQLLTGEFDDIEETLSEAFDTSDTDAAQAMLFDFLELIRTRQTQENLEAVLDLDGRFDTLSDDLDAMQEELEGNITQRLFEADLRDEGFRRLSPLTFDRDIEDPERPWRAGFGLVHVREGFAVDRVRTDGTNVTDDVFEAVQSAAAGTSRLVRGPAGSGKSTVCKQVACRWYDSPDTGPVFYRESGRGGRGFESVGKLEDRIRASNGHTLVVVEDVVRPATDAIYDVIEEFRNTDIAVSFLLDARRGELDDFDDPAGMETGVSDALREVLGSIERYDLPALDPAFDPDDSEGPDEPVECHRIIERFEAKTGRQVTHTPSYIHREVSKSEAEVGDLLYLTYFLPVGGGEAAGLEGDVRAKYQTVLDPADERSQREDLAEFDTDLLRDVALMVNLLNASRLGIRPELVDALGHVHGTDRETLLEIQDIQEALGGWMLYPSTDEESDIEQTTHELWSALYLRQVALRYEEEGDEGRRRGSKERFEDCVNALFQLADDESLRETARGRVDDSLLLDGFDEVPEPLAGALAKDIFELGKRWPILTPLYGTSEDPEIVLPEVCSGKLRRTVMNDLGYINLNRGEFGAARREFETSRKLSEELDDRSGIAISLNSLGLVARHQGKYDEAREYFEESLEISNELGDRSGVATCLVNLGPVAQEQGEYAEAREYLEESLKINNELGDRSGIAANLHNLGVVAKEQREYHEARENYKDSLEILEELGDRGGIAIILDSLGLLAKEQEEYDQAKKYHADSLEIHEELGHRDGIAKCLNNLGTITHKQGNYDEAKQSFERSARMFLDIGKFRRALDAIANLVSTCKELGHTDEALEWCESALTIIDDTDISNLDNERVTFLAHHALLSDGETEEQVVDLYILGLSKVIDRSGETALKLFESAWELHGDLPTGELEHQIALAAGLAVAAHTHIFDDYEAGGDYDDIIDTVKNHRSDLTTSTDALLTFLTEEESEVDSDDLLELADSDDISDIGAVEARAFALLIVMASVESEDEE
jgi:tetratricopeptide (TPR) repeat protein